LDREREAELRVAEREKERERERERESQRRISRIKLLSLPIVPEITVLTSCKL
jgi:hypothetical protein